MSATWSRVFPSGAWQVWDDRLYSLSGRHTMTYYGYTKREAMSAHAHHVRTLRAERAK